MTKTPSQAEYEANERHLFHKQNEAINHAPLSERKESQQGFTDALSVEWRMGERTEWILNGSYGFGAYLIALEVAKNKRMNRAAWFGQTIAALDHNCPANFARQAFLSLPKQQQDKINAEIIAAIESFLK